MKYIPKSYQAEGTRFICENKYCGIFADPGLGKTATTLAAISELLATGEIRKVLILAPVQICYDVWPQEIAKWDEFQHLTHAIMHGAHKSKAAKADADIVLMNPEGLPWFLKTFESIGPGTMLVIDESSKFKSPQTRRFKILKKYIQQFDRRVILTGTPAPNGLQDLWSQIYVLDQGAALGKTISMFRNTYCYIENPKLFTWGVRTDSEPAIQRAIAPYVLRIDAETHLDLPPLLYNHVQLSLPEKAQKAYASMEKHLFAQLDDSCVLANSVSAAYHLCHQGAQGFFYRDEEQEGRAPVRVVSPLHDVKVDALSRLYAELQGKPLLVGYHYRHDAKLVAQALGKAATFLGDDRQENSRIIAHWNAGKIQALCGQISTMSHGLNLQGGGNDLCFFTLTDNLEDYLQMIRRIYRQGVKGQVRIHHLIARNTVDVAIMRRLQKKDYKQNALLEALKEYRDGHQNIN